MITGADNKVEFTPDVAVNTEHYIVAVGASAGGLEAIHEFFDHMSEFSGLSFIVIQHLSPDYKSLLVELVSKHTEMKVFEAGDGMVVEKECIYVIPNNKLIKIEQGKLKLIEKSELKAPNTAIDIFLRSLAEDQKDKAIAIILSGTGTDGTKGIHAVKQEGGLVIVQEPSTARFDGMPQSAIASGLADVVLAPEQMPDEIFQYIREYPSFSIKKGKVDETLVVEVLKLVTDVAGFDFTNYKTPTILRRLAKRVALNDSKNLAAYIDYLHKNPDEIKQLAKDFLINVTQFFRDPQAYEVMASTVIPALIDSKEEGEQLKVWVIACSTGEEAYSLGILIDRCLVQKKKRLEVKIFATDIEGSNIEYASKNFYPFSVAGNIPDDILSAYFIKGEKTYSVIPRIRKYIVFAKQNIIKDPPFIKNDLISCRNMLIYANPALQQKILTSIHYSLNQGGYLFLGTSETASFIKAGMTEIDSKWKIFQKSSGINSTIKNEIGRSGGSTNLFERKNAISNVNVRQNQDAIEEDFQEALVEELGFVGFYIDNNCEIKQTLGQFNKLLVLPEKTLNLNLVKMLPKEIAVSVNTAIRKCWKEKKKVVVSKAFDVNKRNQKLLQVIVKPAVQETGANTFVMIGLHDLKHLFISGDHQLTDVSQSEYVNELENELEETRKNLQLAVEEMDTTNEELQSTNEELLSANEELQSSNEELQSLNEELHTLNTEHQLKIKELIELNDDLDNYFRSTEIGQIFLDAHLQIRKFNNAAVKLINLIETDIGRPISHISHNLQYDQLLEDIDHVTKTEEIVEKEIVLKNGRHSLLRVLPYIRNDKKTDGIVMTFVDITAISQLSQVLKGVLDSSLNAILVFSAKRNDKKQIEDFECVLVNPSVTKLLGNGFTEKNVQGKTLKDTFSIISDDVLFADYVTVVEKGTPLQREISLEIDGDKKHFEIIAVQMQDGFVATIVDITNKKQAEEKLRKNYNELIVARESLRHLNADLETKVKDRTLQLAQSEERFRLVSKATNDALWDWNIFENSLWWSDNFYTMFGYEKDPEVKDRKFWLTNIHPDDQQRVNAVINTAINDNNSTWSVEYRFRKNDGEYANILDRGYILRDEFQTPYRMLGSMFDVTKLYQAEQKIKTTEARFRKVFDSNLIGMVISKFNGDVIDANHAFLSMLGLTREDLDSGIINWSKMTPPEYYSKNKWAVEQLRTKGFCPPFEKEYITKDGRNISVLLGSTALEEEDTSVTFIIDITEQKEALRKEFQLQNRFKFLADAMPQKVWTAKPSGNKDYFNNNWMTYSGLALEQLVNHGWETAVHPDDLPVTLEQWKKSVETGDDFEIEKRIRNKEGEYRWHLTRALALKDEVGNITMWVGTSTDIHDQKIVSEALKISGENFRQLADKTPFMIWRVDKNGLATYTNKPWTDFTGLSFEDSLGLGWAEALHPDDKENAYKGFMQCFNKRKVYQAKFRLRRKDGVYRWMLAQSNPLMGDIFEGYIGSLTDITDQEVAQQSTKLLMQKKDEFMSIASHELKTPITSMKALLQLSQRNIESKADLSTVHSFISKANAQVKKLTLLVEDLLDVTKIHAGKIQFYLSRFSINSVIKDSIEEMQESSKQHHISFEAEEEFYVVADQHRIEQVIVNFLSNAIKYSPEAFEVRVSAKREENNVRVAVQDFGIGIPEDKIPFIFDRFFRVQESSQKFSGLGLGLYISSEIIQRHNGNIGVLSTQDEGSSFWFTLPLDANNQPAV